MYATKNMKWAFQNVKEVKERKGTGMCAEEANNRNCIWWAFENFFLTKCQKPFDDDDDHGKEQS